ncbi:M23 family metallopeptidase [Dokdonella sp.]|uniref:M23 family metallopeptidase n=1 Tax=Dokdonella sp. TaxID=2291710 RepID=UPI0027B90958|nr:M23 family metallopeptidase [Dokdonella sp.]
MITRALRQPVPRAVRHAAGLRARCALLAVLGTTLLAPAASAGAPFPASVAQGSLVRAQVTPRTRVYLAGQALRVAPDGAVVFGIGRDEHGPVRLETISADGHREQVRIEVTPRDWPIERVVGVPPASVEPPPAIAARIAREQARVSAARERDDAREDYRADFQWPVHGRISGRFGNQRIYVVDGRDVPKAPHSGMDIAVPEGTPVLAPAAGIVSFADADLYLTGGTVLLDHGHGVSSNFLHLSRIDVRVGQRIEQGEVLGAAGHTGRASGPHVHWGLNWFGVRLDPLLLLDGAQPAASTPRR